jgi:lycopene cyclase domain-containing protein
VTYWLINLPFLLFALAAMLLLTPRSRWGAIPVTLLPVVLLTAVFDNLIVGARIVAYDPSKISGWMIGRAPIEDFAYAVAGVLLIPSVWVFLSRRGK